MICSQLSSLLIEVQNTGEFYVFKFRDGLLYRNSNWDSNLILNSLIHLFYVWDSSMFINSI